MCIASVVWMSVHKFGCLSTCLDGCPQVWMAVHKFGWLSTSLDGCPHVWMAVHMFGWLSTCLDGCPQPPVPLPLDYMHLFNGKFKLSILARLVLYKNGFMKKEC